MLHRALALEVELDVVQGCAYLLEGCVSVEVGIATGQCLADVAKTPPTAQLFFLGTTEGLPYHLHQVVQLLERFILLYQHLYLIVVQPEALAFIKQM